MKQKITERIREKRTYFDGATGSVLMSRGLPTGVPPEEWNISRPEEIIKLHREYIDAGADIIKTNTFGINPFKYADFVPRIKSAVELAKTAVYGRDDKYIALDI